MTSRLTAGLTDAATWRARALRYTLIFVLLACVLVALRSQTHHIRPDLRDLMGQRVLLQQQKAALELEAQRVTSPGRVRDWALANGMQPFSQAAKNGASFAALPEVPATPAPTPPRVEAHTLWR